MTAVQFAAWRPDVANLNSKFTADVSNVLRGGGFYIPTPGLQPLSTAMSAAPLGGVTVRSSDGTTSIFVGTAAKLWKLNTTTFAFDDVSKAATTYTATTSNRWQFKQFGDFVVATNVNDAMQVFELGVSTEFADLAGSPPRSAGLAVCGDHMMGWDGTTLSWTDTDDITNWTTGNAGSQTFPDGGPIYGVTDATNPFIIQRNAIRAGTFLPGSNVVFTFQKVHDAVGAAAQYSIATRGAFTFFAGAGAFYQLTLDGQVIPIGKEKVDRTVFGTMSFVNVQEILGAVDPFFSRVYFAVRLAGGTAYDTLAVYDWDLQEWSKIAAPGGVMFPLAVSTVGYTLDGLDAVSTSLDLLPASLDSKIWQAGAPVMGAFGATNRLGVFAGPNAEAVVTTSEIGGGWDGTQYVDFLYPVVDTNTLTIETGERSARGDDVSWGVPIAPTSSTGRVDIGSESTFHRFRMTIPASTTWTSAQGVEVEAKRAGWR